MTLTQLGNIRALTDRSIAVHAGAGDQIRIEFRAGWNGDKTQRDLWARRVEMLGDVFETLRRAAEKMSAAGLDAAEENTVLSEFVTPKPYAEV